jgi:chorismate mutase
MTEQTPEQMLGELRRDIDRIDSGMHQLLLERGDIISRLIAIKARQGGGSAFRPGREADMMRRIAERHRGPLPLDTVEGIWRIIISTFTYVQANYSVHADVSGGDGPMRDSARFHFGFTVPLVPHHGAAGVVEAVARSTGDLGMVRIEGGVASGAWWKRLAGADAPKIIARVPFVERPDHPAGMPVFIVSKPLAEAASRDVVVYAAGLERWRDGLPARLAEAGVEIIGNAADAFGPALMLAAPGAVAAADIARAFAAAEAGAPRLAEIGSHARRYEFVDKSQQPG